MLQTDCRPHRLACRQVALPCDLQRGAKGAVQHFADAGDHATLKVHIEFVDHLGIGVAHQLHSDLLRHPRLGQHTDILMPQLVAAHICGPIALHVSMILPVSDAMAGPLNESRPKGETYSTEPLLHKLSASCRDIFPDETCCSKYSCTAFVAAFAVSK